jgi:hypothetical protein
MDEDWELLLSFLPVNWRDMAIAEDALKGLLLQNREQRG